MLPSSRAATALAQLRAGGGGGYGGIGESIGDGINGGVALTLRYARLSAVFSLAAFGAYSQLLLGLRLPYALRVVLFAPLIAEKGLQAATLAVRGPLAVIS